ncbi:MAG: TIGR04283 family arsenosugar biosynthesis glycosyltransferase [Acidobacteria bacterium]|nr:TIGR04283 family arsenosugar biosynthesis glycosyltransferase [Acidobacteriota bacterium]MBI3425303.1 TIGR04283 family arsenosugar biosynthesis glycosyltransferase [Acidobacteriota bacterium]
MSVIIPVLNEARQIQALLRELTCLPEVAEVIVVDGGSTDGTAALAQQGGAARVLEFGRANRALQMNAGAAAARGEALLFLHADVRLPLTALADIRAALQDEQVVGGCFAFGFPAHVPRAYRVYAWGINLRTRWFQTATGDQALFARRTVFEQLGGYPALPLMEDLELFERLKRQGRVCVLPHPVCVSPRRWQQHGLVRTGLLMYALRLGYWLGFSPARLKRFFLDVR